MMSDSLSKLAGPDGISKFEKFIGTKVGNYKSYTINDQHIKHIAVAGGINHTSYNYKLKVTYDKGVVDEVIGFVKNNDSPVKLNSYHANSDLLMQ